MTNSPMTGTEDAEKATQGKKAARQPERRPSGRPSLYKQEYCELATNYCLLGATDVELAGYFKVNPDTIHTWKIAHPEFSESILRGRDKADAHIAKALYHRSLGYSHLEDDIRVVGGSIVVTPTIKCYPPDTAAASLWLRNRQPKKWRDKIEVEHGGSVGFDNAPIDELKTALDQILSKLK